MNKRFVCILLSAFVGVCICAHAQERYTVHVVNGGSLTVTNNIIICNEDTCINIASANNLTTDSYNVFADFVFDFRIKVGSPACNVGVNNLNPLGGDLVGMPRVMNGTIDLGAFELADLEHSSTGIVHKTPGGALTLYNNIIVNNFENLPNVSALVTGDHNLTTNSTGVFVDEMQDFSLAENSPAVNAGNNQQAPQTVDLKRLPRVMEQTVDIGAFEYPDDEHGMLYVVHQTNGGTLNLYNNIIFNNDPDEQHVNVPDAEPHNLLTASGQVFKDEFTNFLLAESSPAINAGENVHATHLHDLKREKRIMDGTVDMGAFEVRDAEHSTLYVIHQTGNGTLQLYNNISILNLDSMLNVDPNVSGSHNLTVDMSGVFVNDTNNFELSPTSPAANVGDNQYMPLPTDIADENRIPCEGNVDLGAYEIQPETHTLTLTANTVTNDNCSGNLTVLTASGGETYVWSHSNETSDTVTVTPLVQTCYTVTAFWSGDCPWSDSATICVDPSDVVENSHGSPSTSGQQFWVSFMRNFKNPPTLSLLISSQADCSGTIVNPNTGWSTNFQVSANQTTQVAIPNSQAYCNEPGVVTNYGLLVTATDNISLFASNFENFTYDVTNILPVPALSNEYITQTYTPLMNTEFLIVATADATTVEIIPSQNTSDGHPAYIPYTVTLNQGQTYLVLSDHGGVTGDLSGSRVSTTDPLKPIAVFNGNVCANIPVGNTWCDHVVEQAFGTHFWGRQFVVTNTLGMPYDRVKITASTNNTVVKKDGNYLTTLQANNSYEFQLDASDTVCFLESSHPCATYLYIPGGKPNVNSNYRGDPSMVWISPVEQRIQEITFSTFNSPNITNHNVNVVIPTHAGATVTFDGVSILSQFHPVPSNPMFSYARLDIPNGTHTLSGSHGVVAHVYGTGHCESYAYSVGSKAALLSQQLYVNQTLSTELEDNEFCTYEEIAFDASVNYPCDSVVWNFGDSYATQQGLHLTHHYTTGGSFPVSMTVFMTDDYGLHCTTIYAQLIIHDGYHVIYTDTVCQGEHYTLHGFDYNTADTAGPVTVTRDVDIPGSECDSTYVLELMVMQQVFPIYDTICVGNDYHGYGFDLTSPSLGTHLLTNTVHRLPCDSITELHLLVTPNINDFYGIHGLENICVGGTYDYYIDTLSGLTDMTWTVPDGAFIQSGQGTEQVTVFFTENVTDGLITLSGTNACGNASFTLAIHPQPVYYIQISDTVCGIGQSYHGYGFDIDSVQEEYSVFIHEYLSETCCDSTIVLTLLVVDVPEVTIQADAFVQCEGESLTLTACCLQDNIYWYDTLNGITPVFDWNTGDTTASIVVTLDTTANYHLFVYNAYGCQIEADTTIVVAPTYNITDTLTLCEGELPYIYYDTVFAAGSVSGQYSWHRQSSYGCDSLVTLNLTVSESTHNEIQETVLFNDLPFELNDSSYTESGTYTQTLVNAAGCDSILTLTLTVLENVSSSADSTVCGSELPLVWNGVTFTEAGTQSATLTALNGVDSVVAMTLTVIPTTYGTLDTAIVENALPFVLNDSTYPAAGTYVQHLANAAGCDSVLTINLTVYDNQIVMVDSTVCEGSLPITWNGVTFANASTQNALLTASTGADSTVVMTLTVIPTTYGTLVTAIVENALPFVLNDSTYPAAGTYVQHLANAAGCDSLLTIHLTVHDNQTVMADSTVCEGSLPFTWNGVIFSNACTQSALLTASTGADSTVVMTLAVIPTTYGTLDTAIVENALPFVLNDSTYPAAGTYVQYIANAAGCDSVLTIHLTVHDNQTVMADSTVCEGNLPIIWNGVTFADAGTQNALLTASTGADSTVVMTLTVIPTTYGTLDTAIVENALPFVLNDSTYPAAGTYVQHLANAAGCDSVLTINLTVYDNQIVMVDSTVCEGSLPITWNGVTFADAGTQSALLMASTGADSTVVMTLTLIPTTYGTLDTAIVENALPFVLNDSTYPAAGTYVQHLANAAGCDSLLTIHLTVHDNQTVMADSTVCEGSLPFTWNGVAFANAGTQNALLTASTGADSVVVMTLTVIPTTYGTLDTTIVENALPFVLNGSAYPAAGTYVQHITNAAGCDSVLTINLTVYDNQTVMADSTVCEGSLPVTWNGVTFTNAGTQNAVLTAFTGADSTVVMTLTVIPTTYGTLDTAVVENALPFLLNDSVYPAAGTYIQHLANTAGCDSLLTIHLAVYDNQTVTADSAVCEGSLPITWNGVTFANAGSQSALLTASTGADSTVVMTLTVIPTTSGTLDTAIVENALPFVLNSNSYPSAGTYVQHITNAAGCDSVLTINLTVYGNQTVVADSTVCEGSLPVIWNGVTFTNAGTQNAVLTAFTGADSVVVMTLTVIPTTYGTLDTAIVENALPFVYNSNSYSTGGSYIQNLTSVTGCDSLLTVNLTVYHNVTMLVDSLVCASSLPIIWHGHTYTSAGTHTQTLLTSHGADSIVTYHLLVDEITATVGNVTHITCFGASTGAATATISGGTTPMNYLWTNASGGNVSTTPSISNCPAGNYSFTVTDQNGCAATATVTLNTLNAALAPGTITADQVVCDGDNTAPFTGSAASGGDNSSYQWQVSADGATWTPAPGMNNTQDYSWTESVTYSFALRRAWVSQSCGTEYSNTVTVTVWPHYADTLEATVCLGEPYQNNGFDITTDQITEPGAYTFVQHFTSGPCDSSVTLLLTVSPIHEEEIVDEVCEGESYTGNGFYVSASEISGVTQVNRTMTLQSADGCDSVIHLTLNVIDTSLKVVSLTGDFCESMSAELVAVTEMTDYLWSNGEQSPSIIVHASGLYTVTASQGDCRNTAHIMVEACANELYLPNAITPSVIDGQNDYFCIPEISRTIVNLFEISIFNRWGELVFYSTDKNFQWNGEYRGEIQYQTIYNYVIRYTDNAGRPHKVSGSLIVL